MTTEISLNKDSEYLFRNFTPTAKTLKAVALVTIALGCLGIGRYLVYSRLKTKITDESADGIILALTLNNTKLTEKEIEQKIRVIRIRKAVIETLENMGVNSPLPTGQCKSLRFAFTGIDALRTPLPGEEKAPTSMEHRIITQSANKIVRSMELHKKPDHLCTSEEKTEKELLAKKRNEIITAVKLKIHTLKAERPDQAKSIEAISAFFDLLIDVSMAKQKGILTITTASVRYLQALRNLAQNA